MKALCGKFYGSNMDRFHLADDVRQMSNTDVNNLFSEIAREAEGEHVSHEMEIRLAAAEKQWSVVEKRNWIIESCEGLPIWGGKAEDHIGANGGQYSVTIGINA